MGLGVCHVLRATLCMAGRQAACNGEHAGMNCKVYLLPISGSLAFLLLSQQEAGQAEVWALLDEEA